MSGPLTMAHPLVAGLIDKKLARMPEAQREAMKTMLQKAELEAQEKARTDAAVPATLAQLAERIARSDARAMEAMEKVHALAVEVSSLRVTVLEMTAAMAENARLIKMITAQFDLK